MAQEGSRAPESLGTERIEMALNAPSPPHCLYLKPCQGITLTKPNLGHHHPPPPAICSPPPGMALVQGSFWDGNEQPPLFKCKRGGGGRQVVRSKRWFHRGLWLRRSQGTVPGSSDEGSELSPLGPHAALPVPTESPARQVALPQSPGKDLLRPQESDGPS